MITGNAIFVYRPKYDGGGLRWPFLSDMVSKMNFAIVSFDGADFFHSWSIFTFDVDVFGTLYGTGFTHYPNGPQNGGWSCSRGCRSNITNHHNLQGHKQTFSTSLYRRRFASNVTTRWLGYK
jgi:hypothetical protein